MKKILTITAITTAVLSTGYGFTATAKHNHNHSHGDSHSNFLNTYADIALANYTDALVDAKALALSIKAFGNNAKALTMSEAKASWLNARESYGQTEIFRLSNGPIDAEDGWVAKKYGAPEGLINAWPLDENMIDYTIDADGKKTSGNIIDTVGNFTPSGEQPTSVNITNINPKSIEKLNENGGEANVAAGYHAIEFLLWGQDQDYSNFLKDNITNGALSAGNRPLSDYTTAKNHERRIAYLNATANLLVSSLESMVSAWAKNDDSNYRAALLGYNKDAKKNISHNTSLAQIFSGMGVFIKSEVANERIAVSVLTPSEEDEHSCFSDNTHRDILLNFQGFKNILFGTYNSKNYGNGAINALKDTTKLIGLINKANSRINRVNSIARISRHFDYQIRPNDSQSSEITKLKNNLRSIGDMMVTVAAANGIKLDYKDVVDSQETKL